MKKLIEMNHIEDTTKQVEQFIREETGTPNNGNSDYLDGEYYLLVEIVKK